MVFLLNEFYCLTMKVLCDTYPIIEAQKISYMRQIIQLMSLKSEQVTASKEDVPSTAK